MVVSRAGETPRFVSLSLADSGSLRLPGRRARFPESLRDGTRLLPWGGLLRARARSARARSNNAGASALYYRFVRQIQAPVEPVDIAGIRTAAPTAAAAYFQPPAPPRQ